MFDLQKHNEQLQKLSFKESEDEFLYDYILRIGSVIMEDRTFTALVLEAAEASKLAELLEEKISEEVQEQLSDQ